MNITEVKTKLGYDNLNLNRSLTEDEQPTEWYRHWDNDNRVAVSMHEDVVAKIQSGCTTLGIQTETREGKQGEYTSHRIVAYTQPEVVL